ncbi:MAG: hypothetical protein KAI15_02530 [Gammaproteobacteria bacterium]|jgi:hypothetical protein|nr:hypothetical protein [Gammaproteobacteria bacterium]MCK5667935.1 hypothetical protein [Gammaproteobacteria bacterium]
MFDYITVGSLIGLVVFGVLWNKASAKVWYMDSDNSPVSLKSIVAFLWLICLVVIIYQQFA